MVMFYIRVVYVFNSVVDRGIISIELRLIVIILYLHITTQFDHSQMVHPVSFQ